jgi:hypothetical protein
MVINPRSSDNAKLGGKQLHEDLPASATAAVIDPDAMLSMLWNEQNLWTEQ